LELSASQMARMSRLLDEALELDEEGRRHWLRDLAPQDRDLEVALRGALLPQAGTAGPADLGTLPKVGAGGDTTVVQSRLKPGDRVGPYRLIRKLGHGGMAEVWLAERADGAFKREVALKLPMLSWRRQDLERRFARERNILASLEHTNIARLYDGGITDEGLPYLAMEYVPGQSLLAWCDAHHLGIRERLRLFMQVLDAVQYAHARQVIHRDLKPSNILVTEAGQVRLLDFGIAKLLASEDHQTQLTQLYGQAMTPEYASPELVRGEAVQAASDIYSLGVALYELLAGARPYRLKQGASAVMLQQAVLTAVIAQPSTQVTEDACPARATTTRGLARRLKGDLDAIVMKALAKDPGQRYASASAMAEDIQRHLAGEPIEARPNRLSYRLGRFVLRNQKPIALAGAAGLLFAAAIAVVINRTSPPVPAPAVEASVAPAAAVSENSIAVLPFVDISEKHDQEYFSDGLTEELIDRLSRSRDLKVIARTSSFAFKGKSDDVRSIAAKLGVANLLEGSVRKSGDALRITAELIRAADGTHLWSQTYDRALQDIFKVQGEIAGTVAAALNTAMNEDRAGKQDRGSNAEVYNLVLQGNFLAKGTARQDVQKAIELFKRATDLDPNYALAWERLGTSYLTQVMHDWGPSTEGIARSKKALARALHIDPGLMSAHATLYLIRSEVEWNWDAAQEEIDRMRRIDAADDVFLPFCVSNLAGLFGHLDPSIVYFRKHLEVDPLATPYLDNLSYALVDDGRYDESVATWRRLLQLRPNYGGAQANLAYALMYLGHKEQALAEAGKETDEHKRLWALPIVYWGLGRRSDSDAAVGEYESRYPGEYNFRMAEVRAYRGEKDQAFKWLDRAYERHEKEMSWIKRDRLLANLHGDPRFQALLVKMKLDGNGPQLH